ncbi:16819_t:CDS:2, partial [Acaulospora colombiana]
MSNQSGGTQAENCPLCANEQPFASLWFQENTETWIKCDICLVWCHTTCLKLPAEECDRIDEYHCPQCAKIYGPSTFNYADLDNGITGNPYKWKRVLDSKHFVRHKFQKVCGELLTLDWIRRNGFDEPIIIEKPDGLGMKMPSKDVTVSCIAEAV